MTNAFTIDVWRTLPSGRWAIVAEIPSGGAQVFAVQKRVAPNGTTLPVSDTSGTAITLTAASPSCEVDVVGGYEYRVNQTAGTAVAVRAAPVVI